MNFFRKQLGFALPIAILIVVALIITGGVGYYSYTSYKAYREIKGSEMVKPEQIITEEDCEGITERFEKGRCYFNLATETKDSSLCKKTTDEAACYQQIAIETKDVSLCKKITTSTSKDGCYYFIAIAAKDFSLCEKIINNIQKTTCYAIVKKDSSICEEITDSFGKQICYKNFAERIRTEEEEVEMPMIEKPEDVVAVVNGVEITRDKFIQKLGAYLQANKSQLSKGGIEQGADETEDKFVQRVIPLIMPELGKSILELMITEILVEQKAKEQNITVKPEEIDKKIDEIKSRFSSEEAFVRQLAQGGMTIEGLRQQFESQILIEKLVAKEVVVTEQDIRDYFYRNKADFAKPEEVRASHIMVRTEEEAKEVLSQLRLGADFAELAKEKSIDPGTKDKDGDLGFFSRGKMTQAFEKAAFALEVGKVSEVVKTPYGYHIIKVKEKKPAQEPNLELSREEIKNTLTQQKTWTIKSNFLQNLRKEAKIEIRLPELRD